MQKLLPFLFAMICSGCNKTIIHLNDYFLKEPEIISLVNDLEENGYSVERHGYIFPESITRNTLVYYPTEGVEENLDKLQTIFQTKGYAAFDLAFASKGNHHYTKYNIGLYVVPKSRLIKIDKEYTGLQEEEPFDPSLIDAEFVSEDCNGVAILDILANGNFVLDSMADPISFLQVIGTWHLRTETQLDFITNRPVSFEIARNKIEHAEFFQHVITLNPAQLNIFPYKCQFKYKVREFKSWLTPAERARK